MSWNYRVIHYKDGGYGVHEVYYNDAGQAHSWTARPIDFTVSEEDGLDQLREDLEYALKDISSQPVLEEANLPEGQPDWELDSEGNKPIPWNWDDNTNLTTSGPQE